MWEIYHINYVQRREKYKPTPGDHNMNDEGRLIVINRFSLNMLADLDSNVLFEKVDQAEAIECLKRFDPVWYINSPQIATKMGEMEFTVVENKGYISLKAGDKVMYININHRNGETTMLFSKVRIRNKNETVSWIRKLGQNVGRRMTATS